MAEEITLLESFDHGPTGWLNYDTYDPDIRESIHKQRHVDLRDFTGFLTEVWGGTGYAEPAPRPERSNMRSVRMDFTGDFSMTSSRPDPVRKVDLVTGFEPTDHFSIAFPDFPLGNINLANSNITLISNGFDPNAESEVITLSETVVPLVAGDSEFRVPLSRLLTGKTNPDFDPTKVTHFQMNGDATGTGTIEINAIRTLAADWEFGGLDMNTLDKSLYLAPNRTGGLTTDFEQPILWHAAEPAGENDPRPIDANFVVPFQTSSSTTGTNRISLYFRELTEDFMTQLDLDGMTQAELNGRAQPDIGQAKYNQRTIGELNRYKLSELGGETIFSLERTPDFLSASWIEFTLQWGSENKIAIQDTEGNGYSFNFLPLSSSTNYVFATYLEENKARAALYRVGNLGEYEATVFDTTMINDDTAFKRRKGRMGWYANLNDGDTRILAIAPNGVTFAEYRSLPYSSQTPVVGAELFATNSPSNELFEEFQKAPNSNAVLTRDTTKSLSGESWKAEVTPTGLVEVNTAIATQPLIITDYANSIVEFDVFVPASVPDARLIAYVKGFNFGEQYNLITPIIYGDQWQHVRLDFLFGTPVILPGLVQVTLALDSSTEDPATFWVDNMSVRERTVIWDGRAVVDDPWNSNDAKWQPFRDNYARANGGIVFDKRGANLQVRGRARKQTATISRVQYKPRYAELGRILEPPTTQSPTYEITNSIANPNGNTTTGWASTAFVTNNTLTATTDGGAPSLLDTVSTGFNGAIHMTGAVCIPIVADALYGFGGKLKMGPGKTGTGSFGYIVYNSANFSQFTALSSGSYTYTFDSSGYITFPLSYVSFTASQIASFGWATPVIGMYIGVSGFPAPWTVLARQLTMVEILPSVPRLVIPTQPFDGDSPNAYWQNGNPGISKLIVSPFTGAILPTFGASNVGLTATLTASASKQVINYEWNFGDGEKGIGSKVVHTYPVSGVYPVSLVATDRYGNQETYSNTVAV